MTLLLAFLIGLFAGLRSLTPPAATAWAVYLGWLKLQGPLALIGTLPAVIVLTLLALFLQIALDSAAIPSALVWPTRVAAVAAPLLVSGGFFAIAHVRALRAVLYAGAIVVAAATLTVGIGLIRAR